LGTDVAVFKKKYSTEPFRALFEKRRVYGFSLKETDPPEVHYACLPVEGSDVRVRGEGGDSGESLYSFSQSWKFVIYF